MLIWTNFDSVSITCRLLLKFHFPIEAVLNSLKAQKGLELVFRLQFLQKIFNEIISFGR